MESYISTEPLSPPVLYLHMDILIFLLFLKWFSQQYYHYNSHSQFLLRPFLECHMVDTCSMCALPFICVYGNFFYAVFVQAL